MTLRRLSLLCLLAMPAALALDAGPAAAQISPFGRGPNVQRLTNADRQMLWQTATDLNEAPSARPGDSRSWHNPQSGNSGEVTLDRVFRSDGMPCHALRYAITRRASAPQTYNLTWCRTDAGEWKIAQ